MGAEQDLDMHSPSYCKTHPFLDRFYLPYLSLSTPKDTIKHREFNSIHLVNNFRFASFSMCVCVGFVPQQDKQ